MNRNYVSNLWHKCIHLEIKNCGPRVGLASWKKYCQQNSISNNNAVDTVDVVHEISLNLWFKFERTKQNFLVCFETSHICSWRNLSNKTKDYAIIDTSM